MMYGFVLLLSTYYAMREGVGFLYADSFLLNFLIVLWAFTFVPGWRSGNVASEFF